jgi:hypothetical protein
VDEIVRVQRESESSSRGRVKEKRGEIIAQEPKLTTRTLEPTPAPAMTMNTTPATEA